MRTTLVVAIAAVAAYLLSIVFETGFPAGVYSYPNPGYPSTLFMPAIFRGYDGSTPTPTATPSPTPTRTPTPLAYPQP